MVFPGGYMALCRYQSINQSINQSIIFRVALVAIIIIIIIIKIYSAPITWRTTEIEAATTDLIGDKKHTS